MKRLATVQPEERDAAAEAAFLTFRGCIKSEVGYVDPKIPIGSLSDFEANKLVGTVIASWMCARAKQLTAEGLRGERFFLATGEVPEPAELGMCETCLPALGDLVEKMGIAASPVGSWSRDDILLFVWTAADLVGKARGTSWHDEIPF